MKLKLSGLRKYRNKSIFIMLVGMVIGFFVVYIGNKTVRYTSTDNYCKMCHVHPHATDTWKRSGHYNNQSGVIVHCVDCHLPPQDEPDYLIEKIKRGATDTYGYLFKKHGSFNWEEKSQTALAVNHTFEASCKNCHQNLFPLELSKEGGDAHLYYQNNDKVLHCINCHIDAGHYTGRKHEKNIGFASRLSVDTTTLYTQPAMLTGFMNFTEYIPGTNVSFDMVAIPGGTFIIGSNDKDRYAEISEMPQKEVSISKFYMGKIEVTWDEYMAFLKDTESEGRTNSSDAIPQNVDAISGATPPFGDPSQGWGKGKRPAITMTFHAAQTYCKWLSLKTGKNYRLPTEAEWEYACRANSRDAYFFTGQPADYEKAGLLKRLFRSPKDDISEYVIFSGNSMGKTHLPESVKENPFGLKNMSGNVKEFCSDWYAEDTYSTYKEVTINPQGPERGFEHVVRGGSFKSKAKDVRSSSRDYTRQKEWLRTDPQMPKSIWWYSDCNDVGFRVICDSLN